MSANGEDYSLGTGVVFVYQQPPPTLAITTVEPPMGPTRGSTSVVVRGMSMEGSTKEEQLSASSEPLRTAPGLR